VRVLIPSGFLERLILLGDGLERGLQILDFLFGLLDREVQSLPNIFQLIRSQIIKGVLKSLVDRLSHHLRGQKVLDVH